MKLTIEEEIICSHYSKQDDSGKVHCFECPLVMWKEKYICKGNATLKEWEKWRKEKHNEYTKPIG